MSDIRFEGWLHRSGTGGVYQDSAGNVGIASTQPQQKLDIGNGGFQVGPTGIATITTLNTTNLVNATPLTNRNLIINGAMRIAQRGTSSTTSGYNTVDRFKNTFSGTDEAPTFAQADVASGTTPYTLGFRKSLKVTNGNQTSGAGAGDYVIMMYKTESQDMANSGWNYLSASNYITLSFWVKASVAQNYYFRLQTKDGGSTYNYPMETGSLSADTWTKITKTIPGNSNLQIDNDNGEGPKIEWSMFKGTDHTASGVTLNQWAGYADGTHTPDQTSTWYTTNDATFEITGVQLELGSEATPFEHRIYEEELSRCKRYFQDWTDWQAFANKTSDSSYDGHVVLGMFEINMRANPTVSPNVVYGRQAGESGWTNGDNNEAAAVHHDPSSTFPGRWFKLTGTWNWHSGYNDTIAVKFHSVNFSAEL